MYRDLQTAASVAHVRNTIDTTDAFYEKEMEYLDGQMPRLLPMEKAWTQALLHSSFRPDFEKEFGHELFRKLEAESRAQDPAIIEDRVKKHPCAPNIANCRPPVPSNSAAKPAISMGLLKHMNSTDREETPGSL